MSQFYSVSKLINIVTISSAQYITQHPQLF